MRPDEHEFFSQVLENVEDLPDGLSERLLTVAGEATDDRADAIRRILEEYSRD